MGWFHHMYSATFLGLLALMSIANNCHALVPCTLLIFEMISRNVCFQTFENLHMHSPFLKLHGKNDTQFHNVYAQCEFLNKI